MDSGTMSPTQAKKTTGLHYRGLLLGKRKKEGKQGRKEGRKGEGREEGGRKEEKPTSCSVSREDQSELLNKIIRKINPPSGYRPLSSQPHSDAELESFTQGQQTLNNEISLSNA